MRRLNIRLVLGLFGFMALTAVAVYAVAALQKGRLARTLLAQARAAEEQGKMAAAIKGLSRYLEFAPHDLDEQGRLGCLLADKEQAITPKAVDRAQFVLEKVLARDPDRRRERCALVRLALDQGDRTLAQEHLRILSRSKDVDAEAEELAGRFHESLGENPLALEWYRKAVSHGPERIEASTRLASLLRKNPNPGAADEAQREAARVMEDLVKNNPEAFRAFLARWNHRREFGDFKEAKGLEEAVCDVARARELAPDEPTVVVAVAEAALLQQKPDEARAVLATALKQRPREASLYRQALAVEIDARQSSEAMTLLRQALAQLPEREHFEFQWSLVHLLLEVAEEGRGNRQSTKTADERAQALKEAEVLVNRIRRNSTIPAPGEYLQGRLHFSKQEWVEASRFLERARPGFENQSAVLVQIDDLLARCYLRSSDPTRHAASLARVVEREPTVGARLALASAEWNLGRPERAIQQYRKILELPNAPSEVYVRLAAVLIRQGRERGLADWTEIETLLNQAARDPKTAEEVPFLQAESLAVQGKSNEATQLLTTACAQDPEYKQPRLRFALTEIYGLRNELDKAAQILDDVERKKGDSAELRVARARLALRRPIPEATAALDTLGLKIDAFPPEPRAQLLAALTEARVSLGQYAKAEELCARLLTEPSRADDLRVRVLMCELAVRSGNETRLAAALEELRRLEGNQGPAMAYGEALQLLGRARQGKPTDLVRARSLLDQAAIQRPTWSAVALARGELSEREGLFGQAIADYRQAARLGETDPLVGRRLVELLIRQQRYREAEEEVRQLLVQAPSSRGVQALAADILVQTRDRASAVRLATQVVQPDSREFADHLWLGLVLAASGEEGAKAEGHLRRALELGPKVPDTWVSLVQFLAARDRLDEAEKIREQAGTILDPDQAPLALAACHEALGQRDLAETAYQDALKKRGDDPAVLRGAASFFIRNLRPLSAEPILRKLVARQGSEEDTSWARLGLAAVLASRGDRAGFVEALPLVGLAQDATDQVIDTKQGEESIERRRAKARVLATRPSRSLRLMAITLLESLEREEGLGEGDRLLLSQLHEATEAWDKGEAQLRRLAGESGRDGLVLSRLTANLLHQGKYDEARKSLGRLEDLEKSRHMKAGALGSTELRIRLLEATGAGEQALMLVKDQVGRPADRMGVARSLARQKRFAEAATWCEQLWVESAMPENLALLHVAILQAGRLTGAPLDRAEQLFSAALAKSPRSAALLMALAGVKGARSRFHEEEELYRRLLELDPRHVAALNNLAWLLSQHSGKADEALPLINKALEIFGPTADLLDTRALVYLSLKQPDAARKDLERAVSDTPSAARYFHLHRVLTLSADPAAAASALAKAKSLGLKRGQLHPVEQLACAKMLEGIE